MSDGPIDLVCWDFGDTLVHERFMRICPPGVPEWEEVYDEIAADPEWEQAWMLGDANLTDLIPRLAERLPMTNGAIGRHLRAVWQQIEWYPDAREWINKLNGHIAQAVVTVNPFEFSGIATACGLDPLVEVIVTSADIRSLSKVDMTLHARRLLGMSPGVTTSMLIDNRLDNCEEFRSAGGDAIHFAADTFADDAATKLADIS